MKFLLKLLMLSLVTFGVGQNTTAADTVDRPIYVPYEDMASLVGPADKAMLMDHDEFRKLLAAAEANTSKSDTLQLGQVVNAKYSASAQADQLTLTGTLQISSLSDRPVAVPLGFGKIGLTGISLNDEPAPLGYDKKGALTLIVTEKGDHTLTFDGIVQLQDLPTGGRQFSITLPQAVAGTMNVEMTGDMEVFTTAALVKTDYDKDADKTSARIAVGGIANLTVVLSGNGRQDDDQAILLGQSASTVNLTRSHQVFGCLFTVNVLRRGVRSLEFDIPSQWTVTEVTCPNLVRWTVRQDNNADTKTLSVRLRSAKTGTHALHIRATALRNDQAWKGPRISLVNAQFQRGFLIVYTDEALGLRSENLVDAIREDISAAANITGLIAATTGRLYFHWGDKWSIQLQPVVVPLRRTVQARQKLTVSTQQITMTGQFEVTAVDREMFDMTFVLPPKVSQWNIEKILVNDAETGFEYRLVEQEKNQMLKIELAAPIQVEKLAKVDITLLHVPDKWTWNIDQSDRKVTVPLIDSQADAVTGYLSITSGGDLDVTNIVAPDQLNPVPVGRMTSLQMTGDVQYAYKYNSTSTGQAELDISRRSPRIAASATGLVTARANGHNGQWMILYAVTRASTKELFLLADKTLDRNFSITSPNVRFTSQNIVDLQKSPVQLKEQLSQKYNLWELILDDNVQGNVVVNVQYERPGAEGQFSCELIRPVCDGNISEQLAIQAGEELALSVTTEGAKEIDAVDLQQLPSTPSRVLEAYQLQPVNDSEGISTVINLTATVYDKYAIPAAIATSAQLFTIIDRQGAQQSQALFHLVNAGRQFLTFRLPEGAQLWSVRIGNEQAKPAQSPNGDYQVPIARSAAPIPVKIVYAYDPQQANLEQLQLGPVELVGVDITQTHWNVVPAPGYRISSQDTKMQTHNIRPTKPAFIQIYEYITQGMPSSFIMGKKLKLMETFDSDASTDQEYPGLEVEEEALIKMSTDAKTEMAQEAPAPARQPVPQKPAEQQQEKFTQQAARGIRIAGQGKFTLPVDLIQPPAAGPGALFTSLGKGGLTIGMTKQSLLLSWWTVGFLLILCAGLALNGRRGKQKAILVFGVICLSSFAALWKSEVADFANGAFAAAASLIVIYPALLIGRFVMRKLRLIEIPATTATATTVLLIALAVFTPGAEAAQTQQEIDSAPPEKPYIVFPYEGSPAKMTETQKVLVTYRRFVELWNQAHPDKPIELPKPESEFSLANVKYSAVADKETFRLKLTADIRTYGDDWVTLPIPTEGLAVTNAAFQDSPAQIHTGEKSMSLLLPGDSSGELVIDAVAKPAYIGQKGSISISLPPLPGGILNVKLPSSDLRLESDEIEGLIRKQNTDDNSTWTVPLVKNKITLRWLPEMGDSSADRTLSAASAHDVYAFHWAMVGLTKVKYTFSAGRHDRFTLLLPEALSITDLNAVNLRDFRQQGTKQIEDNTFKVIDIRLHRPAQKDFELTVRWLGDLPDLDTPSRLLLPRPTGIGRQSGNVTLHTAGGINAKITEVTGGRRTALSTAMQSNAVELADRATPVAKYYWPYRPFALYVQFSRPHTSPKVTLDQLVRINTDSVQLLVQTQLKTEQGRLFGAVYSLPEGYELLSVVGPAVEKYYEQTEQGTRKLYVKLGTAETQTNMAMVLVSEQAVTGDFQVPAISYIGQTTEASENQSGRIGVQVATSLDAQTVSVENLKSITPQSLSGWLKTEQINAVQFAYSYQGSNPAATLRINPLPVRSSVKTFAGLSIMPTQAMYTYRVRYEITGSPVDTLSFEMDTRYAALSMVQSPAMRDVVKTDLLNGRTKWQVLLINEVTGLVDISINFSLPIDTSTESLPIPHILPDVSDSAQTIVAVQNMSRHEINVSYSDKLSSLAVSEQQKLMSREMRQSLQFVFQSFQSDWSMQLAFKHAKPATRIQALVDLMALTTVIDRQGNTFYHARIDLQNRSEQFLKIGLPEGLKLYNAIVAGQPVKPVTETNAPANEVLIPLIKTSPGGLPYEVSFSCAGKTIDAIEGITKISPPAISIAQIPVAQTTWSLVLPAGYHYIRPGGNVTPIAGTAEMMSLGIEATLNQLKRMDKTFREISARSQRGGEIAKGNIEALNQKAASRLHAYGRYLEQNPDNISADEVQRLQSKLEEQVSIQNVIITDNSAYSQQQQQQERYNVNFFLNDSISNTGMAFEEGNKALLEKPEFIGANEKGQIERLKKELETSRKQKEALAVQQQVLDPTGSKSAGLQADDIILKSTDKDADMEAILGQLSRDNVLQVDQDIAQVQMQLSNLADNRSQRRFSKGQMPQENRPPTETISTEYNIPMSVSTRAPSTAGPQSQAGQVAYDNYGVSRDAIRAGTALNNSLQPPHQELRIRADQQIDGLVMYGNNDYVRMGNGAPGPDSTVVYNNVNTEITPRLGGMGGGMMGGMGRGGFGGMGIGGGMMGGMEGMGDTTGGQYVASGFYSLPVTIPSGEVRLDFARASGDAEVVIWAVPQKTTQNLIAVLALLIASAVMTLIIKFWPKKYSLTSLGAKYIIPYICIVLLCGLLFIEAGLVMACIIIMISEFIRANRLAS